MPKCKNKCSCSHALRTNALFTTEVLISHGADLCSLSDMNETVFHFWAVGNSTDLTKILMENPSLARDIGQQVLQFLPHEKLKTCRLVNLTMKQIIDNPNFWMERFRREKKNMTNENITKWVKLLQSVRNNEGRSYI